MCKEFPLTDYRLILWAEWFRDVFNVNELGYPTSSAHINLPGGSFKSTLENVSAEQVNAIVVELGIKYRDIYLVLSSKYLHRHDYRYGAEWVTKMLKKEKDISNKISKTKYETYLKIGISWVDRGLHEIEICSS